MFAFKRAFTLIELLVVISIIAVLVGILLPALGAARRSSNQVKSSSQLRGVQQSMVVFSNSNNYYLPGILRGGTIQPNGSATADSGGGEVGSARYFILLNGQFIASDLLISPAETLAKWTSGPVTTLNHSYAVANFTSADADFGRRHEWKDNASGAVIIMSDRNAGGDASTDQVRSVWTTRTGEWKGGVVWGDNHAEFAQTSTAFSTRYHNTSNSADNLFVAEDTLLGFDAMNNLWD